MTWALGPEVGNERLIEYAALLNDFLKTHRAVILCQYNRHRFDTAIIHDVLRTHPVAILGEQVCPNPYYEPPELVRHHRPRAFPRDGAFGRRTEVRPIRVLLADDHDLVRAGLRALLQGCADIEVVAEAGDGGEALRLVEAHRPDVVLMDLMMPGLNGLEATTRVARDFPGVRVLVLSMNAAEEFVLPAVRAGASGYLLKNVRPAELLEAIRAVARGETYLTPAVSGHLIDDYRRRTAGAGDSLERLTPRQREVLQLVAEGNSTKAIARRLGVTVKTIETYRAQLMEVLDIHDIAGLTRYAIRKGVVSPDC